MIGNTNAMRIPSRNGRRRPRERERRAVPTIVLMIVTSSAMRKVVESASWIA